ncbi:hypothetical protein [Mesorhizobium amorphae]|nr:hypothetical protein [Mesorhizobium amorphae]
MTIDGRYFEKIVTILNRQPFIEVSDSCQSLGKYGTNHPGNVGVLD